MAQSPPTRPASGSSPEESEIPTGTNLSGAQRDVLDLLRKHGLAETRENYIRLTLGHDPTDDEWGPELEGQLPDHLQER